MCYGCSLSSLTGTYWFSVTVTNDGHIDQEAIYAYLSVEDSDFSETRCFVSFGGGDVGDRGSGGCSTVVPLEKGYDVVPE